MSHPAYLGSRHPPSQAALPRDDSADLTAFLGQNLSTKKTAADIRAHHWNLSFALQQGRISLRRAAVLAYINSLLLAHPPIEKQEHPGDDQIDMTGVPRPIRKLPPPPSSPGGLSNP